MVRRADAQKNRAHLLAVARALIHKGDMTPSFNELAKRAGVGVGTVYRHFADHQALWAGLVEEQLAHLEKLVADVGDDRDPWRAFERLFRGAVALEINNPAFAQILAAPRSGAPEIAARLGKLQAAAESIVNRARTAKVVRPDVKAGDLRRLVCGIDLAARAGDDPSAAATRYAEILLAGMRRRDD